MSGGAVNHQAPQGTGHAPAGKESRFRERRYLLEILDCFLKQARRKTRPFTLLLLDVDHFKKINDILGHLAGDQYLKELTRTLEQMIRAADVVGRFGGEEFLVILPETVLSSGIKAAERIRVAVESMKSHAVPWTVTVSIGCAGRHFWESSARHTTGLSFNCCRRVLLPEKNGVIFLLPDRRIRTSGTSRLQVSERLQNLFGRSQ